MIRLGRSGSLKNLENSVEKVSITISSETKNIRKVSSEILKNVSAYKVDDDRLFDIRLCVEEALRNAIVHGNHSDKKLPVKVAYWREGDDINIEVEDEGSGFDYKRLPDPTENENILKNSGRGVYLIKKLMDRVEFNERGNKIKMAKRLKAE